MLALLMEETSSFNLKWLSRDSNITLVQWPHICCRALVLWTHLNVLPQLLNYTQNLMYCSQRSVICQSQHKRLSVRYLHLTWQAWQYILQAHTIKHGQKNKESERNNLTTKIYPLQLLLQCHYTDAYSVQMCLYLHNIA